MHRTIEPAILYFGTPVVLVSTLNPDGSANLAPISSIFWLGWRCMIGVEASSRTAANLRRSGECVLNLPSVAQMPAVNRLALTTGADPVPPHKAARGYRTVGDKFAAAGLTASSAETVAPPRVVECPVQLEAVLEGIHPMADNDASLHGFVACFELRIQRVHALDSLLRSGESDHIDPEKWRPLIMSFQRFYGLGPEIAGSRLAAVPERAYRSPDVDRARRAGRRHHG